MPATPAPPAKLLKPSGEGPSDDYRRVTFRQMWNLGGLTLWECGNRAVAGYREHKLEHRAVYFAFYALFSLAPALIVAVSTIVLTTSDEVGRNLLEGLRTTVSESLPGDASMLVNTLISAEAAALRENTNVYLVGFGWVFLAYSGRVALLTVSSGLDAAYGVDKRRHFWHRNAIAVGIIMLTVFSLLALSVVLQFATDELLMRLGGSERFTWARTVAIYGFKWVFAIAFLLAAVSLVYTFVPSCRLRWTPLSPGGALFAATFLVSTQAFRLYIQTFGRYSDTYGVLAGVVVLMTWLWLTGTLLLFGGQVNSVIHRHVLAELFQKDREASRAARKYPPIGAISDPTPEEVDEEIRHDEAEAKESDAREKEAREHAAEGGESDERVGAVKATAKTGAAP
ncbi:YihY/virulence factor BrkB family protein [Alienimonas californiensis]|uniref:YihY/virulence factor BrkB family protein n=1 Tax=Alienimonas californiensis TaxID=2527989 RepID=UPI0013FCFF28|nr:YihY/virulence factor BrkB family protein [Alienimonas californiensis]